MSDLKRKKIIIALSTIILFLLLAGCKLSTSVPEPPKEDPTPTKKKAAQEQATLAINFGNEKIKTYTLKFLPPKTVYELLEELEKQNKISLEIKEYDFGLVIEAIDEIKNGQDNKYWLYYVNDQIAPQGVAEQKVEPDDKIDFRFEESKF